MKRWDAEDHPKQVSLSPQRQLQHAGVRHLKFLFYRKHLIIYRDKYTHMCTYMHTYV